MSRLPQILLDIVVPVFLLVGVGAAAGRRLGIDSRNLATLAYWILGPVFVFDILARADLAADLVARVVGATVLSMVVVGLVAVGAGRVWRRPGDVLAAGLTTSVYGNVGNFGLAIVAFAFGDGALPLAGIVLLVVNVVGLVVGVAAANWTEGGAWVALRRALTAPMTLAVIPAIFVNVTDAGLPLWLGRATGLVAAALIPMMLLTLGVQLSEMGMPRLSADVARTLATKLVVAPLVAAAAVWATGLTGMPAGVVVLQFAMPPAVFTALIALEHDLAPDLVTTTVLAGTLASAVTIPFVIAWL